MCLLTRNCRQLVGLLRFNQLNVIDFSSNLTGPARGALLAEFNNPNCPVHALVVSSTMALSGMNMHKACNWGIMIGLQESASRVKQAMARICRLGQEKIVHWFVVIQTASFARVMERTCHTKYMYQISVFSQLPLEITGDLRSIMCFDVAREDFGARRSLYTAFRHHTEIKSVADFEADWVDRCATYYSMLARLGFAMIRQTDDDITRLANVLDLIERMNKIEQVFKLMCLIVEQDHDSADEADQWARQVTWEKIDMLHERIEKERANGHTVKYLELHYTKKLAARRKNPGGSAAKSSESPLKNLTFQAPAIPRPQRPPPTPEEMTDDGEERDDHPFSSHEWESQARDGHASDPEGLYTAIGVPPPFNAPCDEIVRIYRKISMQDHPDKHPNDTEEERKERTERAQKRNDAMPILTNDK